MRKLYFILAALMMAAMMPSCHELEEQPNDPQGNFEALWKIIDERYCFLEEKGLDWDEVHDRYAALIRPGRSMPS